MVRKIMTMDYSMHVISIFLFHSFMCVKFLCAIFMFIFNIFVFVYLCSVWRGFGYKGLVENGIFLKICKSSIKENVGLRRLYTAVNTWYDDQC